MTAATTPKSKSTAAALSPVRTKLCLALLVLLGFSLGCSEFVVIGIESDLATELGVSLATAGQLISVFALIYAIATPVLALSTGRFRRYQLLVCYSIVFVLGNLVMALAPNFQVLFASRIILGSVSGALLAVGVTYIPELLSPQQTSLAISVVYGAFSVAMVFITSIGKFVADTLDWHVAMYGTLTFAVLRDELHARLPLMKADELRAGIEKLGLEADVRVPLSISVGVSFYPVDGTDDAVLLYKADKALYEAKKRGKNNCVIYSKELENEPFMSQITAAESE